MKTIVIFLLTLTIFVILILLTLFIYNNQTNNDYSPKFLAINGEKTSLELLQDGSEIYLYLDTTYLNIANVEEFNKEFEILLFENLNDDITVSKKYVSSLLESNKNYIKFDFSNWVNVDCLGIFNNSVAIPFGLAKIEDGLPTTNEAWMCEGVDKTKYPKAN